MKYTKRENRRHWANIGWCGVMPGAAFLQPLLQLHCDGATAQTVLLRGDLLGKEVKDGESVKVRCRLACY